MPCDQQRAHIQGIYKEVPQVRRDGEGEGETEIETDREREDNQWGKKGQRPHTKEDIQVTRTLEKCSTSPIIREKQIETPMLHCYIPHSHHQNE